MYMIRNIIYFASKFYSYDLKSYSVVQIQDLKSIRMELKYILFMWKTV